MFSWLKTFFKKETPVSKKSAPVTARKKGYTRKIRHSSSTSFDHLASEQCRQDLSKKLSEIGMDEAVISKCIGGISPREIVGMLKMIEEIGNNRGSLYSSVNRRDDYSAGSSSSSPISG